ncbi:hypothetical protein G9A89_005223 [Geosiphon pyriformis]|nr:hypothetical protein G9A89_005223 [Geosiphon pyriformis]
MSSAPPQAQQIDNLQPSQPHGPREWIDLNLVVGNATQNTYESLNVLIQSTLTEIAQAKTKPQKEQSSKNSELQRKMKLLHFLEEKRQNFSKILALVKFAKNVNHMKNAQDSQKFLQDKQNHLNALQHGWETYARWIHNSNAKNPDLHTAIDVLTSGTYQRFPTSLKHSLTYEPLKDQEVKETLEKQNLNLETWILTREVIPAAFSNYKVHDGRVTFHVEKEFEISITRCFAKHVDPRDFLNEKQEKQRRIEEELNFAKRCQDPNDKLIKSDVSRWLQERKAQPRIDLKPSDRWMTVDLKFFVQSNPEKWFAASPLEVGKANLQYATHLSNFILASTALSMKEIPEKIPKTKKIQNSPYTPSWMKKSEKRVIGWWENAKQAPDLPLVTLYEFLHETCLQQQMYLMIDQLKHLANGRWGENIEFQVDKKNEQIKIYYWRWAHVAHRGENSRKGIAEYNRKIELAKEREKRFHDPPRRLPDPVDLKAQKDHWVEISITEDIPAEYTVNFSKKRLALTNYAMETSRIKYGSVQNRRGLYYPHRRFQVRWCKGNDQTKIIPWKFDPTNVNVEHLLLRVVRGHADHVIRKFKDIVLDFCARDDSFLEKNDIEIAKGRDGCAKKYWMTPVMRVRMTHDKWIDVSVDLTHGKIVFERNHKQFRNVILKSVNQDITKTPGSIIAMLRILKTNTIMEEVALWASQLELYLDENLKLRDGDVERFGTDQRPKFYHFDPYSRWYLVAGTINCKLKYWLISIEEFEREIPEPIMNYIQVWAKYTVADMIPIDLESCKPNGFCFTNEERIDDDSRPRKKRKLGESSTPISDNDREDRCVENLNSLTKAVALCRAHIAHMKLGPQLKAHKITYSVNQATHFVVDHQQQTIFSLTKSVPVLKLNLKEMLVRVRSANKSSLRIFRDISMRTVGWFSPKLRTCSLIVNIVLRSDHLPAISKKLFSDYVRFDPRISVLSLEYENLDTCVSDFLQDWNQIVMISQLALQVSSSGWKSFGKIVFKSFDFKSLEFIYSKHYQIRITWSNRQYSLDFGVTDLSGVRNPHQRIKDHLQKDFNHACDLKALLLILTRTLTILRTLDELEAQSELSRVLLRIVPKSTTSYTLKWMLGSRPRVGSNNMINVEVKDDGTTFISDPINNWDLMRSSTTSVSSLDMLWDGILTTVNANPYNFLRLNKGFIAEDKLASLLLKYIHGRIPF